MYGPSFYFRLIAKLSVDPSLLIFRHLPMIISVPDVGWYMDTAELHERLSRDLGPKWQWRDGRVVEEPFVREMDEGVAAVDCSAVKGAQGDILSNVHGNGVTYKDLTDRDFTEKEDGVTRPRKQSTDNAATSTDILSSRKRRRTQQTRIKNSGERAADDYHREHVEWMLQTFAKLQQEFARQQQRLGDHASSAVNTSLDDETIIASTVDLAGPATAAAQLIACGLSDIHDDDDDDDTSLITVDNGDVTIPLYADELLHRTAFNSSPLTPCNIRLLDHDFLIPPDARFFWSDITAARNFFKRRSNYQLIMMDPPWQNRSNERRQDGYAALGEYSLLKHVPVRHMLQHDDPDLPSYVAVWVTNKAKLVDFVKYTAFAQWNVELVAEWWWLKVTRDGRPVFPLRDPEACERKPYETLLIGKRRPSGSIDNAPATAEISHRMIVCPLSRVHSLKPPINGMPEDVFHAR